jgi:CheY-like chemotaxis protein/nitrogen-specific signal transduction histidine kinase
LRTLGTISDSIAVGIKRKHVESNLETAKVAAELANRTKSEFLVNMSHEIRTPLTAILGYCDLLREDESTNSDASPERLRTVDTISRAGNHLMLVINDILDLSKIEAGQLITDRVETQLPLILVEVERLMQSRLVNKDVHLATVLETPIPKLIESDPTRLRQILMNLVGNAAKFTERGFIRIRVRTERRESGSRLVVLVEDSGMGMTADQAAMLFTPFNQADSSVTRKFGGTGLGLTISRRLARMMGGDVRLEHTELGGGCRFVFEIPLLESPATDFVQTLTEPSLTTANHGRRETVSLSGRILLAEDGEDNQRLIAFLLRKAGAEVDVAANGRIALAMLDTAHANGRPYDLLVTDMQMPEMDGYSLTSALRVRGSRIPIIALTAHAMREDRQKCLEIGCDEYVSKPIDFTELSATCHKLLTGPDRLLTSESYLVHAAGAGS